MRFALLILILSADAVTAQTNNFEVFALKQDSLQMASYKSRDTKTFEGLVKKFQKEYNRLDSSNKKEYAINLQNSYYNLSCTYALTGKKGEAIDNLRKSIEAGYFNYYHLLEDTDLDTLRNEDEFKQLVESIREVGDYKYILKKGEQYNLDDDRSFPKFTYMPATDSNLVTLRKTYNLDSIVGGGNEVTKVINLMHWVHDYIPHDGSRYNPSVYSAIEMLAICKKETRPLNCRGLATVLNECYLAMGFPSRMVTCMPKDSLKMDSDVHVINQVYIKSLKKWVWMDPTHDAYIMSDKGELLGIEEVRQKLINDEILIVNPDANWNHKSSVNKDYYLDYYMAKNLYMLECSVNNVYNLEGRAIGRRLEYVSLLPLDYHIQKPDKTEHGDPAKGPVFIRYKTNNPELYWQAPE